MHSRAQRRYGQKLKFDFSFSAQAYSVVGPISKQVLFYNFLIGSILGGGKSHFMFIHSLCIGANGGVLHWNMFSSDIS